MAKKPNPLLAKFEAQLQAQYRQQLEINSEFDLIAFMLTINEDLHVGPGRAAKLLNDFLVNKLELADAIHEDYGPDKETGDKELAHTKATYAKRLRSIFSPEDWQKCRIWFPFLRDYWEG
jgi:hypothetical protein